MHRKIQPFLFVLFFALCFPFLYCSPSPPQEPAQEARIEASQESLSEPAVETTIEPKSEPTVETSIEPKPEPAVETTTEPKPEPTAETSLPDAEHVLEPPAPELIPEIIAEQILPQPGFGQITGACGELDDSEWNSSNSFLFRNTIDLGTTGFDETKLTAGGQKLWKDGNLGGSSVHSEIFAYEVLQRCELAKLLKSEREIQYTSSSGKKTDILVEIDTRKIGVSVTRAFHYPPTTPYTVQEAADLLKKKLSDIPLSASNATPQDAWVRSILSVIAYDKQYADTVEQAYKQLDAQTKANIILIVTVTDGKDDYVY